MKCTFFQESSVVGRYHRQGKDVIPNMFFKDSLGRATIFEIPATLSIPFRMVRTTFGGSLESN